jgi:endoglucanase
LLALLLGRNQNPRYGAPLNGELPHRPIGNIAGGPNSALQGAVARELAGCVGQSCYVDDINSFSTNEIAINWNAPLAWVASFLANQAGCR